MNGFPSMNGSQLELALESHDGTPFSFLKALRTQLDDLNPDRAQVEKHRSRPAIVQALQKLRAHAADQYGAARSLFPSIGIVFDVPVSAEEDESEEGLCASPLALQEPEFVLVMPKMAPDARRARGTPVSALSPSASPLRSPCNRGLTLLPTSLSPRVSIALVLGI